VRQEEADGLRPQENVAAGEGPGSMRLSQNKSLARLLAILKLGTVASKLKKNSRFFNKMTKYWGKMIK
jgi:hypothetical protein